MKLLTFFSLLTIALVGAGVLITPGLLVPATILFSCSIRVAYTIGAHRGFIIDEDELPRVVYQVVTVIKDKDGYYPVAILRDSKKRRIACRSCTNIGFAFFHVTEVGDERFFVPSTLGALDFVDSMVVQPAET